MKNFKTFILEWFSIDERRTSALVICMIMCVVSDIVWVALRKEIPINMLTLTLAFVGAVSGTSAYNAKLNSKQENQEQYFDSEK